MHNLFLLIPMPIFNELGIKNDSVKKQHQLCFYGGV